MTNFFLNYIKQSYKKIFFIICILLSLLLLLNYFNEFFVLYNYNYNIDELNREYYKLIRKSNFIEKTVNYYDLIDKESYQRKVSLVDRFFSAYFKAKKDENKFTKYLEILRKYYYFYNIKGPYSYDTLKLDVKELVNVYNIHITTKYDRHYYPYFSYKKVTYNFPYFLNEKYYLLYSKYEFFKLKYIYFSFQKYFYTIVSNFFGFDIVYYKYRKLNSFMEFLYINNYDILVKNFYKTEQFRNQIFNFFFYSNYFNDLNDKLLNISGYDSAIVYDKYLNNNNFFFNKEPFSINLSNKYLYFNWFYIIFILLVCFFYFLLFFVIFFFLL